MFSGPLEKTAFSLALGIAVGVGDAVGFFYTVKFFLANSNGTKKTLAGFFEFFRLIVIVAFIIFLSSKVSLSMLPFLFTALFLSMTGKTILVLKGLKK
jgi:hypothetical protein